MIKSAHEYPIHSLFDPEAKISYYVPKYQREYSWKENNWEDLFNDIDGETNGYFLGTILVIDQGNDVFGITPLEIIDGQQRLLTISILYAAIYLKMLNIKVEDSKNDDFVTEKQTLKYRLVAKSDSTKLKLVPQEQNNNLNDYRYIIHSVGALSSNSNQPKNFGNRKLSKAFRYFEKKLNGFGYDQLIELLAKVNGALVVKIEVSSYTDAYLLFQSLNNRGAPLLATDLIKTSILSEIVKNEVMSLDNAYDIWQQVVDNITQDPVINERFLRHYYNAFNFKKEFEETFKKFSRATKTNLIKIYNDNLIPTYSDSLLTDLLQKSKIYGMLVTADFEGNEKISRNLTDLAHVRGAPAYAFLLYLFSEYENMNLLEKVTEFIVKWYARRNLTDFPATRNADSIFIKLIKNCQINKGNGKENTIDLIVDELKNNMSTMEVVSNKLQGDLYDDNPEITRFLLSKLEELHITRENGKELWKRNSNGLVFTIEHIFPEGKNIPQEWIDMIAGGDSDLAEKLQKEYVHKIGNLTLTAYNSNLSNLPFEKKRDREDENGNKIGYKNGLYLNNELREKDKWTIDEITSRGNRLVSELKAYLAV